MPSLPNFRKAFLLSVFAVVLADSNLALGNPIVIEDVTDLQAMNADPSGDYILGNDIDASDTINWNDGAGFVPIADVSGNFSGTFDGAGYTISHLYIAPPSGDAGLFRKLLKYSNQATTPTVRNVTLENVHVSAAGTAGAVAGGNFGGQLEQVYVSGTVSGGSYAGGLVGLSNYRIVDCHFTGSVTGASLAGGLTGSLQSGALLSRCSANATVAGGTSVGGLSGFQSQSAIVESSSFGSVTGSAPTSSCGGAVGFCQGGFYLNSYSQAVVSTEGVAGGFVGRVSLAGDRNAQVINCYSTGLVDLLGTGDKGGLIGAGTGTVVRQSFWDVETSGQATSSGGTGLPTSAMQSKSTYENAGWDFSEEWSLAAESYPMSEMVLDVACVTDLGGLQNLLLGGSDIYVLLSHLDAWETSEWSGGMGFEPIGDAITPFTGRFYGSGYAIDNLNIVRPDRDGCGLFGETSGPSHVSDLVIRGASVVGQSSVGILVGHAGGTSIANVVILASEVRGADSIGGAVGSCDSETELKRVNVRATITANGIGAGGVAGTVLNSSLAEVRADGSIAGSSEVGGIAGRLEQSLMNFAHSFAFVETISLGGGLIGKSISSAVHDSFSGSGVSGDEQIGGAIGATQDGTYDALLAYGSVTGLSLTGGLIGSGDPAVVTRSFWDDETSGQPGSAGGEPKHSSELYSADTFENAGWDTTTVWDIDEGVYYPYLRWHPYIFVSTLADFQGLTDIAGHYALLNDVDAAESASWNSGAGFEPLFGGTPFVGTFNGRSHAIRNLEINGEGILPVGLFGEIGDGGIVEHLQLENIAIVDTWGERVGGVAGSVRRGSILGVDVQGVVSGLSHAGVIAADADGAFLDRVSARGRVSGGNFVGGLLGIGLFSTVKNSYSASSVDGESSVGGIVGHAFPGTIVESASLSDVTGQSAVGGIAGAQDGGAIFNSHVLGSIRSENEPAGAVVGAWVSTVRNVYQSVSADYPVHPVGVDLSTEQQTERTYVNDDCCGGYGYYGTAGEIALTTEEMRESVNYIGWDFQSVWNIVEGASFPYLRELLSDGTSRESLVDARNNFHSRDTNSDGELSFGEGQLSYGTIVLDNNGDSLFSLQELLALTVGPTDTASDVYVDFEFQGDELGTLESPFNSIYEGASFLVGDGSGTLHLVAGSSDETPILTKAMRLVAEGGKVTVGAPSP